MTGIIIQARMSSTRLPGKVLKKLAGREVLWHVVERCRRSKLAEQVVVATSKDPSDDRIFAYCAKQGVAVFRGDLEDVLSRYYHCAKEFEFDSVVRITSDCPLVEPKIIDGTTAQFRSGDADYVSDCLRRTFPRGLDCEVFSFAALERARQEAAEPFDREHVTPYIVKHLRTAAYAVPPEYEGNFRLTLDEAADFELLSHIYDKFYRDGTIVNTAEVIAYLRENPTVAAINSAVKQKHSIEKI